MAQPSKEKEYLIVKDVTLEQWLELMQKRPKNVLFEHYQFPTDEIKMQFISNISNFPEKTINTILKSFLNIPSSWLGFDKHMLDDFEYLLEEQPGEAKRLLDEVPYYQRLLRYIASKGKVPIRDGISWIMDLLPFSPREALDALEAYEDANIEFLPDGIAFGLEDAMAILRARYFSTDDKVATSVLNSLKPTDLEYLVEALYHVIGYITEMTKPSHDGGRDIIATKNEPGKKEKILIQCKRWQNVVSVEDVRALLGVVAYERATKGVLITTSYFSPSAEKLANAEPRIELISGKSLQQLLTEHLGESWVTSTDHILSRSMQRHPLNKRK